jgi:hypothetical protein
MDRAIVGIATSRSLLRLSDLRRRPIGDQTGFNREREAL